MKSKLSVIAIALTASLAAQAQNLSAFPSFPYSYGGAMSSAGSVTLNTLGSCNQGSSGNGPRFETGILNGINSQAGAPTGTLLSQYDGTYRSLTGFAKFSFDLGPKVDNVDCRKLQEEVETIAAIQRRDQQLQLEEKERQAELARLKFAVEKRNLLNDLANSPNASQPTQPESK